ncbi:MAG: ACT domain-containing protein [Candidatus Micrarchaeota archaeon]
MKENVSELVWLYVKRRPYLREVLRTQVVNYSALARKLALEIFGRKRNETAVKAALIRTAARLSKIDSSLEEKVMYVLRSSSLTITSKVAVVVSRAQLEKTTPLSFAKSRDYITYIIPEANLKEIKKAKAVLKTESTLNLITVHSKEEIEETPGVIAMILDSLSAEGVNVVEFISCYTDTLLVVKESDTAKAYEVLSALTR